MAQKLLGIEYNTKRSYMNKVWDGVTPKQTPSGDNQAIDYAAGYRDAMNSPEIRAMYEALYCSARESHFVVENVPKEPFGRCSHISCKEYKKALVTYELGMRDK